MMLLVLVNNMKRILIIILLLVAVNKTGGQVSLVFVASTDSDSNTRVIGYTVHNGQVYKVKERTSTFRYLSE